MTRSFLTLSAFTGRGGHVVPPSKKQELHQAEPELKSAVSDFVFLLLGPDKDILTAW